MKSTIIFYTHNFLSRKLFESTLSEAIRHAEANDCFLLIISHFPVLSNFEDVSNLFGGSKESNLPDDLSKFCIRDLRINLPKDRGINYVTGKLPYSCRSILNQLIFSFRQCKTDNAILCEHDCFYPSNYYSVVEKNLKKYDMTYCKESYWMLNRNGFYQCEPHMYLSSYSARTEVFRSVFEKKAIIYKDKAIEVFEPIVPHERIIKDINWIRNEKEIKKLIRPKTKKDVGLPVFLNSSYFSHFRGEIITTSSICIDEELGGCILEFQHGLNTSASLANMRLIYDKIGRAHV